MRYVRTSSLKRLFSFRRQSFDGEIPKACGFNDTNTPTADAATATTQTPHRPTWKCFSFQEIFHATNGFGSGYPPLIYTNLLSYSQREI